MNSKHSFGLLSIPNPCEYVGIPKVGNSSAEMTFSLLRLCVSEHYSSAHSAELVIIVEVEWVTCCHRVTFFFSLPRISNVTLAEIVFIPIETLQKIVRHGNSVSHQQSTQFTQGKVSGDSLYKCCRAGACCPQW